MMRFGRNSGARKVRYRKRKAQKCHLRFCGTVNKRRALLPKRGALQVVKTKTCLWYFCGQTRNRRGFYHGDFHFWWTRRGSNPRPLRCERSALPAELRAHIGRFLSKKVAKNGFLGTFDFEGIVRKTGQKIGRKNRAGDGGPYGCERSALPAELRARGTALQQRIILYHNFHRCKDYFFRNPQNFLLPIRPSYSKINKL